MAHNYHHRDQILRKPCSIFLQFLFLVRLLWFPSVFQRFIPVTQFEIPFLSSRFVILYLFDSPSILKSFSLFVNDGFSWGPSFTLICLLRPTFSTWGFAPEVGAALSFFRFPHLWPSAWSWQCSRRSARSHAQTCPSPPTSPSLVPSWKLSKTWYSHLIWKSFLCCHVLLGFGS